MTPIPNVILFGASGCGKSSIINMLHGSDVAKTSSGATGCTFQNRSYKMAFYDQVFNIYDRAGLGEAEKGAVPNTQAIVMLYDLLRGLSSGVNLLVFCMRAPRLSESATKNWTLFKDIICNRQVPIITIVTALENQSEQPGGMDSWWFKNRCRFEKFGMTPRGQACITTIRGKQVKPGLFAYGQEYNESREKVMKIVHTTYTSECFRRVEHKEVKIVVGPSIQKLVKDCGMSAKEADALAKALDH